jgi:hypothetical protein
MMSVSLAFPESIVPVVTHGSSKRQSSVKLQHGDHPAKPPLPYGGRDRNLNFVAPN